MLVLLFPALLFIQVFERYSDNRFMRSFSPKRKMVWRMTQQFGSLCPAHMRFREWRSVGVKFEDIVRLFPDPVHVLVPLSIQCKRYA
jgi:hypothetical protein